MRDLYCATHHFGKGLEAICLLLFDWNKLLHNCLKLLQSALIDIIPDRQFGIEKQNELSRVVIISKDSVPQVRLFLFFAIHFKYLNNV